MMCHYIKTHTHVLTWGNSKREIHGGTSCICLKKEKEQVSYNSVAFWWKSYSRTGVWAVRTSLSAPSTVGEDVAVFCLEGRRWPGTIMPAAASKAPLKYSSHNFSARLYVFSRWLHFWVQNKVVKGIWFHLLPWEQRWMKMFHGSLVASSLLVCMYACVCEYVCLWMLVCVCLGKSAHVSVCLYASECTYVCMHVHSFA